MHASKNVSVLHRETRQTLSAFLCFDAETGTCTLPRSTEDDTERHYLSSYSTDAVSVEISRKPFFGSLIVIDIKL